MQVNNLVKKAKLVSKEIGKIVAQEKRTGILANAVSMDTVTLTNAKGKGMRIFTYRDIEGRPVIKNFTQAGTKNHLQRNYEYGNSESIFDTTKHYYRQVKTYCYNAENKPLISIKEIIATSPNEQGKIAVTKSKLGIFGIKDGYGNTEYSGIGLYENKKPANFYLTYTQRNKNKEVVQQHLIHSKDTVPKEIYENEYLPLIQHEGNAFNRRVFNHVVKREGLQDRGIKFAPEKMGFRKDKANTFASYVEYSRTYRYNVDVPFHKAHFINCTEHELTHAKQHKKIELLGQGKLSGKEAQKAEIYKKEFDNYIPFDEDEIKYKAQLAEAEALEKGFCAAEIFFKISDALREKFAKGRLLDKHLGF